MFQKIEAKYLQNKNQLMLVDFAALRNMFREHRPFFLHLAGGSHAEAQKQMDRLDDVLQNFDAGFLAANIGEQRTRLIVGSVVIDGAAKP